MKLQFVELKQVFRQSDQRFADVLRRIRLGLPGATDELKQILKEAAGSDARRQSLSNDSALHLVAETSEAERINNDNLKRLPYDDTRMCVYEAIDSVRVNENFTHEQAKKAETQLEHIGIPKRIRISKRLELRQGAKVMMLKNMEIMVGDSETVKLVNGSRGVVTKMVSAKQMLPELKERSKKWDEEYKKKRQELERERLTDKEMDKELKPLQSRYQKLTMQI